MKNFLKLLFAGSLLSPLFSEAKIEISDVGFMTPESVEYYAEEDVYLVSNIHGSPLEADGNGFISKVKPDGSVQTLKWLDGEKSGVSLDAPKGMEIVGQYLYVTDLTFIRVFELPSGKQRSSIEIKESTFLNGITPAGKNSVYVTDSGLKEGFAPSGTDAIYKVMLNGNVEKVYEDPEAGRPNGIIRQGKDLWVVTFGSGEFFKIDEQGKKTLLPKPGKEGLDGLVKVKGGQVLMSSWGESGIYAFDQNQQFKVLFSDLDAPADMGVDTKRNRLLVPLFKENKVVILPLD